MSRASSADTATGLLLKRSAFTLRARASAVAPGAGTLRHAASLKYAICWCKKAGGFFAIAAAKEAEDPVDGRGEIAGAAWILDPAPLRAGINAEDRRQQQRDRMAVRHVQIGGQRVG